MINVNARAYETRATIRPIVLPHECRCLFLLRKKNFFNIEIKIKSRLIDRIMHRWTITERRWTREQTRRHDEIVNKYRRR
jgi:hypothetical protein